MLNSTNDACEVFFKDHQFNLVPMTNLVLSGIASGTIKYIEPEYYINNKVSDSASGEHLVVSLYIIFFSEKVLKITIYWLWHLYIVDFRWRSLQGTLVTLTPGYWLSLRYIFLSFHLFKLYHRMCIVIHIRMEIIHGNRNVLWVWTWVGMIWDWT